MSCLAFLRTVNAVYRRLRSLLDFSVVDDADTAAVLAGVGDFPSFTIMERAARLSKSVVSVSVSMSPNDRYGT